MRGLNERWTSSGRDIWVRSRHYRINRRRKSRNSIHVWAKCHPLWWFLPPWPSQEAEGDPLRARGPGQEAVVVLALFNKGTNKLYRVEVQSISQPLERLKAFQAQTFMCKVPQVQWEKTTDRAMTRTKHLLLICHTRAHSQLTSISWLITGPGMPRTRCHRCNVNTLHQVSFVPWVVTCQPPSTLQPDGRVHCVCPISSLATPAPPTACPSGLRQARCHPLLPPQDYSRASSYPQELTSLETAAGQPIYAPLRRAETTGLVQGREKLCLVGLRLSDLVLYMDVFYPTVYIWKDFQVHIMWLGLFESAKDW